MAKNLVGRIPLSEDEFDAYTDAQDIEQQRAKVERVSVRKSWAEQHCVDDQSIMLAFSGDTQAYILSMPVKERFSYLKLQAEAHGRTVPVM